MRLRSSRNLSLVAVMMLVAGTAAAQSPTYGVGRTPTEEEIRAWDISISPTGAGGRRFARALRRHSRASACGCESHTMPLPVPNCA